MPWGDLMNEIPQGTWEEVQSEKESTSVVGNFCSSVFVAEQTQVGRAGESLRRRGVTAFLKRDW